MMRLPNKMAARLRLPLIAAPMFRVSGPELVIAACRAGVIGAFPSANCRTVEEYDHWLTRIGAALGADDAPFCPNLIMRRQSLMEELVEEIEEEYRRAQRETAGTSGQGS